MKHPDKALWLIVNTSRSVFAEDAARVSPYPPIPGALLILYPDGQPSIIYDDLEAAEKELLRLSQKHPDGEFFLFQTVATSVHRPYRLGMSEKSVTLLEPVA
jgi:hypothetical protein